MADVKYEHEIVVNQEQGTMLAVPGAVEQLADFKRKLVVLVSQTAPLRILRQTADDLHDAVISTDRKVGRVVVGVPSKRGIAVLLGAGRKNYSVDH
jgi:hypothetical protein